MSSSRDTVLFVTSVLEEPVACMLYHEVRHMRFCVRSMHVFFFCVMCVSCHIFENIAGVYEFYG